MQYYHELCLKTMLAKNIFIDGQYKIFKMAKNNLPEKKETYDEKTAKFLLNLCISTTQNTFLNIDPKYDDWNYSAFYDKNCSDEKYNKKGIVGYVLNKSNTHIIVFTGTNNASLAAMDFNYKQKKCDSFEEEYFCHGGFAKIFDNVVTQINRKLNNVDTLYITGHSLGGALSTICASYYKQYNPIHYSFASPMCLGKKMAIDYEKNIKYGYRIYNMSDIVSMSPLPIMPNGDNFYHVGESIQFQDNGGKYSYNHTESYIRAFNLYISHYVYNQNKD